MVAVPLETPAGAQAKADAALGAAVAEAASLADAAQTAAVTAAAEDAAAKADAARSAAIAAAEAADRALLDAPRVVTDGIGEWWIHPLATFQQAPYPRTVFGAIASDGTVLACEINHAATTSKRYEVGMVDHPDDHDVPALYVAAGRRSLIAWTWHGDDSYVHYKVGSRSGDLGSLTVAPELTAYGGTTSGISYTQIHRIEHLSDDAQDTFWIFTRRGNNQWIIIPLTVDQATGASAVGERMAFVTNSAGQQMYVSTADAHADGNQVIRTAITGNPASTLHSVTYLEIDCVTGVVSDPVHGGATFTLGTFIDVSTETTPLLPDIGVGYSRRLFYTRPGPDPIAVAYADWSEAAPDMAVYKVTEWTPGVEVDEPGLHLPTLTASARCPHFPEINTPSVSFRVVADPLRPVAGGVFQTQRIAYHGEATGDQRAWMAFINASSGLNRLNFRGYPDGTSAGAVTRTSAPFPEGTTAFGVDADANTTTFYYSTDVLPADADPWDYTYTVLGTPQDGVPIYAGSSSGLVIGHGNEAYVTVVRAFSMVAAVGSDTVIAAPNFARFPDGMTAGSTFEDEQGNPWTLTGDARVSASTPASLDTYEAGVAGPRFGYVASANYIAGMAFDNPSHDRSVYRARQADGVEYVEKLRFTGEGYDVELLASQPSSAGRLARPCPPVNGGPIAALVSHITRYAHFEQYDSDVRAVY